MWFNPIIQWLLRSPLHLMVSKNMMLMTYTGRKSGKIYTTPMNYLAIGEAFYTISTRERRWWRNLRAGADVSLRIQGEDLPAWAICIEDPAEVADRLHQYLQAAPQLAKYLNVRIGADGIPNSDDVSHLAQKKIIVQTVLK